MKEISSYVERAEYLRKLVIIQELLFQFSYCYYPEALDAYHARFTRRIFGVVGSGSFVLMKRRQIHRALLSFAILYNCIKSWPFSRKKSRVDYFR